MRGFYTTAEKKKPQHFTLLSSQVIETVMIKGINETDKSIKIHSIIHLQADKTDTECFDINKTD